MARSLENFAIGNFVGKLPGGWQRDEVVDNDLIEESKKPDTSYPHLHSSKFTTPYAFYQAVDAAIVDIGLPISDVNKAILAYEQSDRRTAEIILLPLIEHLEQKVGFIEYDLAA